MANGVKYERSGAEVFEILDVKISETAYFSLKQKQFLLQITFCAISIAKNRSEIYGAAFEIIAGQSPMILTKLINLAFARSIITIKFKHTIWQLCRTKAFSTVKRANCKSSAALV